eukprot:PLAT14746.1.p2 GENE.PLAT14746.1~~PLAT14746.1.p2  ORF type:complete len:159 (-),score=75.00 PLAT14746.1:87-563(-)
MAGRATRLPSAGSTAEPHAKWAKLVEQRLKPELAATLKQLAAVRKSRDDYHTLASSVEALLARDGGASAPLSALVDVGAGFRVRALAKQADMIYVAVGLGFRVAMAPDEVLAFVPQKLEQLAKQEHALQERAQQLRNDVARAISAVHQLAALRKAAVG